MNKSVQIINGPNLNLLGTREIEIYGSMSLEEIESNILNHNNQKSYNLKFDFFQSNTEGEIVSQIQKAKGKFNGLIINAGGLSHTSVAILDALLAIDIPKIEVHLSNLYKREEFRHHSFISKGVNGIICGFGANSYLLAVDGIVKLI